MNIPDTGVWGKETGQGGAGEGSKTTTPGSPFGGISKDWVLLAIIVLTGTLCFGMGLIAARENPKQGDSLWIEQLPNEELPGSIGTTSESYIPTPAESKPAPQPAAAAAALPHSGAYVASKSGTKYYLPTCSGATRIKDENKVWFATKQAAEAAGYCPSSTCKGL